MKELLGISRDQLAAKTSVTPEKHQHPMDPLGFSVFIEGNEFLFYEDRLFSIKIKNFSTARRIPGFEFPIEYGLERTLAALARADFPWEIDDKYSNRKRVTVRLKEEHVLYEFEFSGEKFELQFIRFSPGMAAAFEESPDAESHGDD